MPSCQSTSRSSLRASRPALAVAARAAAPQRRVRVAPRASCAALLLALLTLLAACQQPGEPVPELTQEQWRRVRLSIIDEVPEGVRPVGATFDGRFELVGWLVEPAQVEVGGEVELVFYWRVLEESRERWEIFVHLEQGSARQTLDHDAVGGNYPTPYWSAGQLIEDRVRATLGSSFTSGRIDVLAGFFRGESRLPITDVGSASADDAGRLQVGSFDAQWTPAEYEVQWREGDIRLDGRLIDRAWARAAQTTRWVHPTTGEPIDGHDTWARALWDDEYLYIGMRARDTDVWATLTTRDADLWDEEVLEVYIDGGGRGRNYLEIQVNPNNAVFDALFPRASGRDHTVAREHTIEGMETAVHVQGTLNDRTDRDVYWSVEMRIPWASIPGVRPPPGNDTSLRVNFYRYDRPARGGVITSAWSPVGGGTFHRPDRFGRFVLRGRPEIAPTAEEPASPDDAPEAPPVQP